MPSALSPRNADDTATTTKGFTLFSALFLSPHPSLLAGWLSLSKLRGTSWCHSGRWCREQRPMVDLNPAIQNRTYKISALGLLCAQNLTHKDFLFLYCMKILFCYLVSTWKVENLLDKLWFCKMSLDVVWEVPWGVRLGFYKHWQCTTVTVQCQLCLYSLFSCSWFKSIIFLYFCSRSGGLTKLLGVNYYLPLG